MLLPLLLTLAIPQMGFDQSATVHHFHLFPNGGAIEINTRTPGSSTRFARISRTSRRCSAEATSRRR